ncbi:molecular chaperone TorD family protein [Anoxynatronum sibiricum]|uniref:Molecular chaperone TorD family protein n=1 Tax=Anoxynatronum sibiricum TaxID=210623 RepID=A0ABU9VRJ0_9CLOT
MEIFIQQERLRGSLYHLLSKCYQIPGEFLKTEEVVKQLHLFLSENHPRAAAEAAVMLSVLESTDDLSPLVQEFLTLFVGPKTLLAPPYGSLYLEDKGQIMGPSTFEAMKYYEAAGLQKSKTMHEPDDHLRIELEFISYLIGRVLESSESNRMEAAVKFAQLQTTFLERHLGNWVHPFANNMENQATSDYFKALARLTILFVGQDVSQDSKQMLAELQMFAQEDQSSAEKHQSQEIN